MDQWERFTDLLNGMKTFIASQDWQGLERHYSDLCGRLSGVEAHDAVRNVMLTDYEEAVNARLARVLERSAIITNLPFKAGAGTS